MAQGNKLFVSLLVWDFVDLQRLPEGKQIKQGIGRVWGISCDGLDFPETVGCGDVFQAGQRAADDLLGSVYDPLHCLPVLGCGACVPHTQTVRQYALHRGVIEGQQQLRVPSWGHAESVAAAEPSLPGPRCCESRSGLRRCGCPETWRCWQSPLALLWWGGGVVLSDLPEVHDKFFSFMDVEGVLVMAGLQPHLAWVRLIGLWLGGAAHLWCMSNHGTQDKPAITTHTRGGATVMASCNIASGNTTCHLQ